MATKQLHISPELSLPLDAVTETFWFLGKRGSGKTHDASVFVEEMLKAKVQVIVLDPMSAWYGLRSSVDGRSAGLPIAIFGGPRGDIPLEPGAGAYMADLAVAERVSMVLDVKEWSKSERTQFVTFFLERLLARNSEPVHVVLEEADVFAPQRPVGEEKGGWSPKRMLGAAEALVRRGRGSGIGTTLITQRSASINKEVSTQTEVLVAHRLRGPQDIAAALEWFQFHDPDRAKEAAARLPHLATGSALVTSTEFLDFFGEVAFRPRETFDSSATPKMGQARREARTFADIDLAAVKEAMAETIERAKADDPKELRRQIAALRKQLNERPTEKVVETITETVEVPVLSQEAVEALRAASGALYQTREVLDAAMKQFGTPPVKRANEVSSSTASTASTATRSAPARPNPTRVLNERQPAPPARPPAEGLTGPQQRVLDALAWWEAVGFPQPSKLQVGAIAGYRVSKKVGGAFGNILGALRSADLIVYPSAGTVALTSAGRALSTAVDIELTTEGLQRAIMAQLTDPERRVLRPIIDAYPDALTKQEAGAAAGYLVSDKVGGGFGNILGRLRSLGLVDYPAPGMVAAEPVLFLDDND